MFALTFDEQETGSDTHSTTHQGEVGASVHLTKFVGVCCLLLGTMVSRPCNASNAFLYTPGDW